MTEYDKIAERATHTPEPWQLFPHGTIQNADGLGVVAYLAMFEAEWIANGNLIIAAPDLLAALEALLDDFDCGFPISGRNLSNAMAAIAKARGSV